MNIRVALRLGRISNLPTVWTNCLAGAWLSGGFLFDYRIFLLLLSMSLLYVSGMFLNDAFDYVVDLKERPDRPIPSKQVSVTTVFAWGILLMLCGLLIFFSTSINRDTGLTGLDSHIAVLFLCILIVFYDWKHKENPFSPYIMGACRGMLYLTAGLMYVPILNSQLAMGAMMIFSWIIGLTFLAKQENTKRIRLWPTLFLIVPLIYGMMQIPLTASAWAILFLLGSAIGFAVLIVHFRKNNYGIAISTLIASISLLDGLLLAVNGFEFVAISVSFAVLLTLFLQKYIPGT